MRVTVSVLVPDPATAVELIPKDSTSAPVSKRRSSIEPPAAACACTCAWAGARERVGGKEGERRRHEKLQLFSSRQTMSQARLRKRALLGMAVLHCIRMHCIRMHSCMRMHAYACVVPVLTTTTSSKTMTSAVFVATPVAWCGGVSETMNGACVRAKEE